MSRHHTSIVIVMALLLGWLAQPASVADGQGGRLKKFQSRHYLIHTDLPRPEVVRFGRHMDAIFEQYSRRFANFQARNSGPMDLYLLRSQKQYLKLLARNDINATNTGGMFFVTESLQGLATWIDTRSRCETFRVLQHEGFHQFAWNYLGHDLPIWMNEGLAQYFEDGIIVQEKMKLGLANAQRIDMVRHAIRENQVFAFGKLLNLSARQWAQKVHGNPDRSAVMYAQAWSIVYYLIHGERGRYHSPLIQYLKQVSEGRSSDAAIADAFGSGDLSSLQSGWRSFAQKQQPDPINAAAARMEFLGMALRYLHEHDEQIPQSISNLKRSLQARKFTVTRQSHGMVTRLCADDDTLFEFSRNKWTDGAFQLLESTRNDLPPRITAPGLRPEPTLTWSRDDAGQLVAEIQYR